MKKILIMNGSPRLNGNTASLIQSFTEGAEASGNEVRNLYLQGMQIGGCLACESCQRNGGFCVQKDDMEKVNEAYLWADVIVFASPMFWGTVSGQLKTAVDRWYALMNRVNMDRSHFRKETAMLMTSRSRDYDMAEDFLSIFTDIMGWKCWGKVLGRGKEKEAYMLGASIH